MLIDSGITFTNNHGYTLKANQIKLYKNIHVISGSITILQITPNYSNYMMIDVYELIDF